MGNMDARYKEMMNSSLLCKRLWLSLIFMMAVDVLFGDSVVYCNDMKNGQCHTAF